ncbi:MAG: RDD family protein [Elusimicrobiaceae bacterium]|nr:RDD family protein [Elusimicrobiaceae bacterium]
MNIQPYAGFWKRFAAYLIDACILLIPTLWITSFAIPGLGLSAAEPRPRAFLPVMIINNIIVWLYFAGMESSKHQATIGKMALGIKVVDPNGARISFWRATGRNFAKILSTITLNFGYFMAGFTAYRQALHDIICSTFVVSKNFQQGETLPKYPFHTLLCVLSTGVCLLPFILPFIFTIFIFLGAFLLSAISVAL